ncbi:hypothetical protein CsSME_00053989 [Camellia sinensis var. sinensis]
MSDFFPDEMVVEILQRLPTKSLIQFRSVSKSWNSLITSPNFINSHLNHSLTSNTYKNSYDNLPLLIVRQCISVPPPRTEHYKLCIDTEEAFDEYKQLEFPFKTCRLNFFFAIGSAKGLFCFFEQDRYFLWNPSIRKSMAIPKPTIKTSFHRHGFGFDPRNNDYKVVRIDNFYPTKDEPTTHIEVYSLNAGLWKMSSTAINSYPDGITLGYTERFASYLEGAVHFVANMKKSNDPLILSFDLSDEVFQTMMLPNGKVGVRTEMSTSVFGGLLSLLCYEYTAVNKSCSIWIMKEYGVVDSWCKQFTVDLSGGIAQILKILIGNGIGLLDTKSEALKDLLEIYPIYVEGVLFVGPGLVEFRLSKLLRDFRIHQLLCNVFDVSNIFFLEQIDLMRFTAISQGHVLDRGVGVKGKDLNGSTSSEQGSCNKEYKRDDDLEEHLRKMKAKSAKMLKNIVKSNFSKKGISPHHTSYQKEILIPSPDLELHVRGKICPTFAHPLPQTLPMSEAMSLVDANPTRIVPLSISMDQNRGCNRIKFFRFFNFDRPA